jgi:hypothetical protein
MGVEWRAPQPLWRLARLLQQGRASILRPSRSRRMNDAFDRAPLAASARRSNEDQTHASIHDFPPIDAVSLLGQTKEFHRINK